MLHQIIESCQFLLHNFPGAEETKTYLDGRLDEKTQKLFSFGFYPSASSLTLLTSLVGEDALKEHKLLFHREVTDSLFPRTLSISYFEDYPLVLPFKNVYGETVAIVGRTLLSDKERKDKGIPKYKNTVFTKGNHLFGLFENKEAILENDLVFIVEGQFDVIKAVQKGMKNIVALGSSNMTLQQLALITRYTNNIVLLLDNDEAGEKGRDKIMEKFGSMANIQNFYLPDLYKDIDEYLSENSYEDLYFTIRV